MFERRLLEALAAVPRGSTRTVSELARDAGRPWAAREAGRILARQGADLLHRVIRSDGALPRGARQLRKLAEEGARPGRGEPIGTWLTRAGARLVGFWPARTYCRPGCAVLLRADPARLEPITGPREAGRRAFRPCARCAPPVSRARPPDPLKPGRRCRRCGSGDGAALELQLEHCGCAILPGVLNESECAFFNRAAARPETLRREVSLERHAFGHGEYGYVGKGRVANAIDRLRESLYARLLPSAQLWRARLGRASDLPETLAGFEARCAAAGQRLPASTLLRYGSGGWNAPHRDIYGPVIHPFQVMVVVSAAPYTGGAFAVIENREEEDDLWHLARPRPGDAVVFPAECRPLPPAGTPGRRRGSPGPAGAYSAVPVRHALLPIRSGARTALGLVFHAAAK